jgi:uncharacterized lipoprotein YajG
MPFRLNSKLLSAIVGVEVSVQKTKFLFVGIAAVFLTACNNGPATPPALPRLAQPQANNRAVSSIPVLRAPAPVAIETTAQ